MIEVPLFHGNKRAGVGESVGEGEKGEIVQLRWSHPGAHMMHICMLHLCLMGFHGTRVQEAEKLTLSSSSSSQARCIYGMPCLTDENRPPDLNKPTQASPDW